MHQAKAKSVNSAQRGFSLVEISIVLIIVGVVSTGVMAMVVSSLKEQQYAETMVKMDAIKQAVQEYRRAFMRIPCPADATQLVTAANFGVEAANAANCTGGAPAANFATGEMVLGMVPTKTLRLPDEYAFDGWGRRIMYAADRRYTEADAFITYPITDLATGSIEIADAAGTASTSVGIALYMSFGPNGHGAFMRQGSATRNYAAASTNTNEWENCDCNATAATAFDNVFIQQMTRGITTAAFDDIVLYETRATLSLPTE